jgi:hypothetical protein
MLLIAVVLIYDMQESLLYMLEIQVFLLIRVTNR